ncbi:glycine cleavage system H protein [Alkalibacterium subtropicum]|uniref:Glycine cleavage system H protein n=1 Tax=Alkalibacterium subtropicum TaxID=753702 RepID=A0A1I1IJ65_9LACT|nr:glycine cleavage system protein H [Alkalibacterium subtropicum]SFC34238.1 glycine cleavage system H protein [Alkalibacterium subtropicum]
MTVKYHQNGIWIEKMNDTDYRIGLSEKGQDDVGEVMFAEVSENKGQLDKGDAIINVEGAKAVTELTLPFAAKVIEKHTDLEDEPDLLNKEDRDKNWILTVTDVDPAVWGTLDTELIFDKEESEEQ